jgi:signal transduction histidine kinase
MIKSAFLRRIVVLILAAVLLAGLLSAGIYILVTQKIFADMRAKELTPLARTVAELMAYADQPQNSFGRGTWLLLDRENKDFLGASLHIFDANGDSIMNQPQVISSDPGGPDGEPRNSMQPELSDAETATLVSSDLEKILSGFEASEIRKTADGKKYLVVGAPIISGDIITGAVIFTKSMSELNDTLGGLNITLIISTLAAFIIMLIPAYFATRRLVLPIKQMQNVAFAMADGDFSVRADDSVSGEIGDLGKAMNHFAEESGRLEQTRRDYVANVSHELRTPIASIRAVGETLRDGMVKTEEKKEFFYNNIVRESMRLSRLVDDLMELSRLQSGTEAMQKSEFDLREVLSNIQDLYTPLAEQAGVKLSISSSCAKRSEVTGSTKVQGLDSGTSPRMTNIVHSNPDRIEQLLVILMDNAIKYTPELGEINISLSEIGHAYEVSVSNTGEGIPNEDLPHIFERFYKVDKSHSGSGTGLGLSIAKEITKGLGESIRAESKDGITTFTFTLSK